MVTVVTNEISHFIYDLSMKIGAIIGKVIFIITRKHSSSSKISVILKRVKLRCKYLTLLTDFISLNFKHVDPGV